MNPPTALPDLHTYCPRCAAPASPSGGKRFACAACDLTLYFNPAVSASAIIEVANHSRVMLIERAQEPAKGKWAFVGGFVDPGESAEVALAREIREEIGLACRSIRYLGSAPNLYQYRDVQYAVLDLFFVCVVDSSDATAEASEVAATRLFKPEDVDLESLAFDSMRQAFQLYRGD